jgi:hypothetical protein
MGFLLTSNTVAICPHGGILANITNIARTPLIDGCTIWIKADQFRIYGCPVMKTPCIDVDWHNASLYVHLSDSPVLTSDSIANCMITHGGGIVGRAELVSYQRKIST